MKTCLFFHRPQKGFIHEDFVGREFDPCKGCGSYIWGFFGRFNIFNIIVALTLGCLVALAFCGCSPLKPYKDVAKDRNRDSVKRAILAPVCNEEFPVIDKKKDSTETVTYTPVKQDTNALRKLIEYWKAQAAKRPDCPQINTDSVIASVWAAIPPCPPTKETVRRVVETKADSAAISRYQNSSEGWRKSFNIVDSTLKVRDAQVKQFDQDKKHLKTVAGWLWSIVKWWLIGVVGVLLVILFWKKILGFIKLFI